MSLFLATYEEDNITLENCMLEPVTENAIFDIWNSVKELLKRIINIIIKYVNKFKKWVGDIINSLKEKLALIIHLNTNFRITMRNLS